MERRDYILHQIQEMGAFLARLAGKLKKEDKPSSEEKQSFDKELDKHLGLNLDDLLFLEDAAFVEVLEEKLLAKENLTQFAGILEQLGDLALNDETFLRQQIYYNKACVLLDHVDENSGNYSMERQQQLAALRLKLGE